MKLKQRELKTLKIEEWVCGKCQNDSYETFETQHDDVENLNANAHVTDINFDKYNKMVFNPLRYESISKESKVSDDNHYNNIDIECEYVTFDQLSQSISNEQADFTLLNLNIRSANKNLDQLRNCLKSINHNFTIIGLTETQLKDIPHGQLHLQGYKLEYMNRVGRKSGGICLYIRDDIEYKLRPELCKANCNFESCFIEVINSKCRNIIVGGIYRSHSPIDNFNTDLEQILQTLSKENKDYYLLGDFNIDLLKDGTDRPTSDFLDLIYSYHLVPTILKPTRITETSATLIDNILTNYNNNMKTGILVTDITDHFPTVFYKNLNVIKQPKVDTKYTYKRNHSEENVNWFKQKLSCVHWNEILDGIDASSDYDKFISKFVELYDECIPLKKITANRKTCPQQPWMTKGLLKSINMKNNLYKKYLSSPTGENLSKFKTYRNKLNTLIRKGKREYYHNKFESTKSNIRQTWKTINEIIGRNKAKNHQNAFKTDSGNIVTEPGNIADCFNNFFVEIGPNLASNIQHSGKDFYEYLDEPTQKSLFMKPVVADEVLKIISKFDQNKSPGHDGIGNLIVKKVAQSISKPLAEIINLSLSTGSVPEKMKIAKVIPIYKKDNAEIFSNYRPVSVLPCFSKILERLVFNRCINYINKYNLLNEKQFGFRPNHSTYMAIIELVDKVANAVEKNETTIGIFLDLSKAFDTINHDILLYKLEHYGFRGIVLDWFKSYLHNRKQFVRYKMHDSNKKVIKCGVPQGSILGPLLFILYINDIVNTTSLLELILFADDTTLLFSHPDIASKNCIINNELQEICNWFQANKLSVNAKKTNYMVLGTCQSTSKIIDANQDTDSTHDSQPTSSKAKLDIKLDGVSLNRVSSTKFLGVIIDENLTWKNHIDAISKTISRNIGMMTKLKHFVPENILYTLYCTLVLPYINYGILIWGNTCTTYLEKILKLQKWAIRTVTNSHYRSHTGPLFSKYNALTSTDTFKLNLGIFMYKHHTNQLPNIFSSYFVKHSQKHNYQTRNAQDYSINNNKKVFSDRAIRNCGPMFWNTLDSKMKNCKTTKHFKNVLKASLIKNYK